MAPNLLHPWLKEAPCLETASTAATSASLKKQELEQGRKSLDRAQFQINQANNTAAHRLEDFNLDRDTEE